MCYSNSSVLTLMKALTPCSNPFLLNLFCSCGGSQVEGFSVHPGTYACFWHVQLPPLRPLVWRQCFVCGLQRKSSQSHCHLGKLLNPPGFSWKSLIPDIYVFVLWLCCLFIITWYSMCQATNISWTSQSLGYLCYIKWLWSWHWTCWWADAPVGGDQILV